MFDGGFLEATNNSATFPEDDKGAWEELIAWSYNPSMTAITPDEFLVLNAKSSSEFFKRMKLCALAEKYSALLLHNLAIDTLVNFLYQEGDLCPTLKWEVFGDYCHYAFAHR